MSGPVEGPWGVGSLDNDPALDWLGALEEAGDPELVADALEAVAEETGAIEAAAAQEALAAAEVVATALGRPPGTPLDRRLAAVSEHHPQVAAQDDHALEALDAVVDPGRSGLHALWHADEELGEAWEEAVHDLRSRLAGAPGG